MLSKDELKRIRQRFEAGGVKEPLCIEGDHIKDVGPDIRGPVRLGWHVRSRDKSPLVPGSKLKCKVAYANNTTFEAATFLVHLPVDMARMLDDLEGFHLLLEGVLNGDEQDTEYAKYVLQERKLEEG